MMRVLRVSLAALVLIVLFAVILSRSTPAVTGRLTTTAAMHDARSDHTSTLLRDGRVLIAGGMVKNGVFLNSAELYDPVRNSFAVAGTMRSRRVEHTATFLPNGKVLIAGGLAGRVFEGGPGVVATTEIFDPDSGQFTAGPEMSVPRTGHGAVLLHNGKVLIFGGTDVNERPLASAEIYDPTTNRFAMTGAMHDARIGRAAVVLTDGRVLVTGGCNERTAEIYDPRLETWHITGPMIEPRGKHAAVLLPDGRVFLVGGQIGGAWGPRLSSTEMFDPSAETFSPGPEMNLHRFKLPNAVVVTKDGNVVVAGGAEEVEVYDPAVGRFLRGEAFGAEMYFSAATALQDGRILITGSGRPGGPATNRAWLYKP